MKRKQVTKLMCVLLAGAMAVSLTGCGGKEQETKGTDQTGTQTEQSDISGTTIRFASSSLKDEATQAVWDQILADYKEKSGVTVEMENFENGEFRTWITTQHAANSAPDVFDMNYSWGWEDYGKGYLIDFNDVMNQPNPYNNNQTLKDTMSESLMQQAVNPNDNSIPGMPSRVLGVKIIYNKKMLEDALVTEIPKTYPEFIEACKKLKAKGYVPFGFANAKVNDAHMNWWLHNFVSQMDADLREKMDQNGDQFITKNELVAASDQGEIQFDQSPFVDALKILKDFSQYFNSDFNSTDQTGAVDLWLSEKVAMTTIGSFQANLLGDLDGLDFDYGLMPLPILTTEDYKSVTGKSLNNGGRLVDVYSVTKNKDARKQKAALDFVHYMLSPDVLQKLMDAFMVIPPLKDMTMSDALKGWLMADTEDVLHANYFGYATSKEFTDFQVLTSQVYLTDDMTLEEYTKELNTEWKNMCESAKIENGWSEENGYGNK